jgi:exosome complex component RRP42
MNEQCSGSCRVQVDGGSDIIVGVKVSVGEFQGEDEETEDVQDVGKIICKVSSSPTARQLFERKEIEEICTVYTQYLNRTFNGPQGGIDLKKLSIVPGGVCWVLSLDILIFEYGGNVLDTIFMAVRGALYNTRLARTVVESADGAYDFDVADEETETLAGREAVPISVTVSCIGDHLLVDPNPLEEICSGASVSVLINNDGSICGIQKGLKQAVEPSVLTSMLQKAQSLGLHNIKLLDEYLFNEEKRQLHGEEPTGFR